MDEKDFGIQQTKEAASIVVQELLDGILEEVVTQREFDIAAKGRRLSEGNWHPSSPIIPTSSNTLVDISSLVLQHTPENVLVSFSMKRSHVQILQLKCVKQTASGYCGHYALHFVLCMLEIYRSKSNEIALGLVEEITSVGAFWRRYWWSISLLMERARIEDEWPWTEKHVHTGDMERSFLRYLLSVDPHVDWMGGKEKIVVVQYAYGFFQNGFKHVCEIQEKISEFCSSSGPVHITFILGVTNHWVVLTAYKTGEPCLCGRGHTHLNYKKSENTVNGCYTNRHSSCTRERVNLIYLDSNNAPAIIFSDDDILKRVEENEKEIMSIKGKGYDEWRRSMHKQAYKDQRDIVLKLASCLSGECDLRGEVAEDYTHRFLASFSAKVDDPLNSEGPDLYLPLLLNWIENFYPPQMLREFMFSPTFCCLSETSCSKLLIWAENNSVRLKDMPLNGLYSVELFISVLHTVKLKIV